MTESENGGTANHPSTDERRAKERAVLEQARFGSEAHPEGPQYADSPGRFWLVTDRLQVSAALLIAWSTGRPLLVTGEPGTGKSSLARALASSLDRRFLELTITSRTEPNDLLWTVDHVARLRDAQRAAIDKQAADQVDNLASYVHPGVLWTALSPGTAATAGSALRAVDSAAAVDTRPAVVLIDEIDKADPDLPESLLGPLGNLSFTVDPTGQKVTVETELPPLVIITSNGERDLSPAFERRCVNLLLQVPNDDELVAIAHGHLGDGREATAAITLTRSKLLGTQHHEEADGDGRHPYSIAAFIDAARAVHRLGLTTDSPVWDVIDQVLLGRPDDGWP